MPSWEKPEAMETMELPEIRRGAHRGWTVVAVSAALALAAGGSWLLWKYFREQVKAAPKPAPVTVVVRTQTVEPRDIPVTVEATGFLRSPATVRVAVETQGRLVQKLKSVGDPVRTGEELARMDESIYQKRIDAGRARETALRTRQEYLAGELEREERLARLGSGRPADLDRLRSEKRQVDAALLENAAVLAEAQLMLSKCRIIASWDGVWYEDLARVGEYLRPGEPVGLLRAVQPLELEVEVSGRVRLALNAEQTVAVELLDVDTTLDPMPSRVEGCRIRWMPAGASQATGRFPVVIRVPNATGRLLPGLFARAEITLERRRRVLLVPKECVVDRYGKPSLYILRRTPSGPQVVDLRYVTVRGLDDLPASWHVESGLRAGERVVLSPLERLRPGLEVRAEEAEAGQAGGDS